MPARLPARARFAWLLFGALAVISSAHADPQALFETNCALCHQKGAVGVRGQFPRLAGRVGSIAAIPAGRTYLQQVVLFGMAGNVEVDGSPIMGVMPSFAVLSDDDLASILTYVAQLAAPGQHARDVKPFSAAELAKIRATPALSPIEVNGKRAGAVASKSSH